MSQHEKWWTLRVTEEFRRRVVCHLQEAAMRSGNATEKISEFVRRAVSRLIVEEERRWRNSKKKASTNQDVLDELMEGITPNGIAINGMPHTEDYRDEGEQ